jgi:AraC-like DNA-binding protein
MGCSKWMFHRKKPFIVNGHLDTSNVASVCGQYDNAIKIKSDEDMDMICVFFQPYALKFMMGIPGDVFTQNSIDFDCLENPELSLLKRHVLDADTDRESLDMIEKFLIKQLLKSQENPYMKPLVATFKEIISHPDIRVDELAKVSCLSERQFRRVFTENVGITPKQMIRLQRFMHAAHYMQKTSEDEDDIINKLGYTDHSHFYKDFQHFASMSPSEYLDYLTSIHEFGDIKIYNSYHLGWPDSPDFIDEKND